MKQSFHLLFLSFSILAISFLGNTLECSAQKRGGIPAEPSLKDVYRALPDLYKDYDVKCPEEFNEIKEDEKYLSVSNNHFLGDLPLFEMRKFETDLKPIFVVGTILTENNCMHYQYYALQFENGKFIDVSSSAMPKVNPDMLYPETDISKYILLSEAHPTKVKNSLPWKRDILFDYFIDFSAPGDQLMVHLELCDVLISDNKLSYDDWETLQGFSLITLTWDYRNGLFTRTK